ncbi:RNA polymerase sigma factor [Demequina sp. NBRC 110056]|uniref:RNA polymerase sigma factor n=1 Tax=Demequina sp. NBRC 110056 TaxID=1570345 RepID=UPI001F1DB398|nr:sigma-70 family RNA polymerase sigma factor [Demequina sp. NBRC 110056]
MSAAGRARREDALADAMREHGADVLRYLQRRSPDAAADLLGETMLIAWRRKADAPGESEQLRPWLFGIARMCLRGHRRDESRRLRLTERIAALAPIPLDTDEALALDVRAAIAALPEPQRELVELVHWEGLSIADAAAVVDTKASTARSRYAKARATLEEALASAVCEVP